MMSRISTFTTLFLLTLSTASASNARLRNFQLKHEIDRMEERIDMLEQQLENSSSSSTSCTFDDECSDLPQCDNGYGNQCYCQLPMGVCDGQFLTERQTGHCVRPRFGCNRSMKPVVGCDGKFYGNPSCAAAAAVNVLCDIRADPDCTAPTVPDDADE